MKLSRVIYQEIMRALNAYFDRQRELITGLVQERVKMLDEEGRIPKSRIGRESKT
jgi:hypothetical protein